jgi:hypothetical protein
VNLSWPADVAGVRVETEGQVATLVARQVEGVGPWSARDDVTCVDGLGRALDGAGPLLPLFARAVAEQLVNPDLAVRTAAVAVADRVAPVLGSPFLVDLLRRRPELFAGVAPVGHPTNHPDLRWSLLVALGRAVRREEDDAIAVLRDAAGEERGSWLLGALARVDLDWLLSHARGVVPVRALGGVLRALPDRETRAKLIRALGPWAPAAKEAALAAPFWAVVPDGAELRRELERC